MSTVSKDILSPHVLTLHVSAKKTHQKKFYNKHCILIDFSENCHALFVNASSDNALILLDIDNQSMDM